MLIDYTAQRSLIGGHSAGTAYQFTLNASIDKIAPFWKGSQQMALDGSVVTLTNKQSDTRAITTIPVNNTDRLELLEFLDSVRLGETFEIDSVDHVLSNPNGAYTQDQLTDTLYRFSFTARKL